MAGMNWNNLMMPIVLFGFLAGFGLGHLYVIPGLFGLSQAMLGWIVLVAGIVGVLYAKR